MPSKNIGRPVTNRHKVPVKQWRRWSNHAKKVFNDVMQSMRPKMQWAFLHPKAKPMMKEHWQTVRWNAAWEAAHAANGSGPLGKVKIVKPRKKR